MRFNRDTAQAHRMTFGCVAVEHLPAAEAGGQSAAMDDAKEWVYLAAGFGRSWRTDSSAFRKLSSACNRAKRPAAASRPASTSDW